MFKKKIIKLIVCTCSTLFIFTAILFYFNDVAFSKENIINGIDANFPPFSFIDKTGNPRGFDVESLNWIAKRMGFTVQHKAVKWNKIISTLVEKKIDVIASGLSITDARKEKINFTIPYWNIEQVMVVNKNSAISIYELLHKHNLIGVQRGTSEAKWLRDNVKIKGWNYNIQYYKSFDFGINDLLNKKIVAMAMDNEPAKQVILRKKLKILGNFGMHPEQFGYAVNKSTTKLLAKLNKGLKQLMKSAYFAKLITKYNIDK